MMVMKPCPKDRGQTVGPELQMAGLFPWRQ